MLQKSEMEIKTEKAMKKQQQCVFNLSKKKEAKEKVL